MKQILQLVTGMAIIVLCAATPIPRKPQGGDTAVAAPVTADCTRLPQGLHPLSLFNCRLQ